MQFDKVSLFFLAPDATLRVLTTVSANGESCSIVGTPMIEIGNGVVQLGYIRLTTGALHALEAIISSGKVGLIQEGDYRTADPNTRR